MGSSPTGSRPILLGMEKRETLCFECGQVVGDPPVLNRHEDGSSCRCCAERVLDSIPPALPRTVGPDVGRADDSSGYEYDLPGADLNFDGDDPA